MTADAIDVDGIEVSFVPLEEGAFRVVARGREIGKVELVRGSTELVAYRPDGEPLRISSGFGGPVTARFSSRAVVARALLEE